MPFWSNILFWLWNNDLSIILWILKLWLRLQKWIFWFSVWKFSLPEIQVVVKRPTKMCLVMFFRCPVNYSRDFVKLVLWNTSLPWKSQSLYQIESIDTCSCKSPQVTRHHTQTTKKDSSLLLHNLYKNKWLKRSKHYLASKVINSNGPLCYVNTHWVFFRHFAYCLYYYQHDQAHLSWPFSQPFVNKYEFTDYIAATTTTILILNCLLFFDDMIHWGGLVIFFLGQCFNGQNEVN